MLFCKYDDNIESTYFFNALLYSLKFINILLSVLRRFSFTIVKIPFLVKKAISRLYLNCMREKRFISIALNLHELVNNTGNLISMQNKSNSFRMKSSTPLGTYIKYLKDIRQRFLVLTCSIQYSISVVFILELNLNTYSGCYSRKFDRWRHHFDMMVRLLVERDCCEHYSNLV